MSSDCADQNGKTLLCIGERVLENLFQRGEAFFDLEQAADLVAKDAEGYLRVATSLAAHTARLQSLREGLRARLRASPLMDAAGFARQVEEAYRGAWQAWLGQG